MNFVTEHLEYLLKPDAAAYISLLSVALAIFSLFLAKGTTKQIYKALNKIEAVEETSSATASKLSSVSGKLVELEASASTRSIGEYPYHLDEIPRLLYRAKKEVKICGIVSYGATFHKNYSSAIEAAIRDICHKRNVEIKIITEDRGKELAEFRRKWSEKFEIEAKEKFNGSILNYIKSIYNETTFDAECESAISLRNLATRDHKRVFNSILSDKPNGFYSSEKRIPVHFWIVDNQESIFVIKSFPTRSFHAFITRDKDIIESLNEAWEEHKTHSIAILENPIDSLA